MMNTDNAAIIKADPREAVRAYIAAHPIPAAAKATRRARRAAEKANAGWYKPERLAAWRAELAATRAELAARPELRHVHVSEVNEKTLARSVSLMPFLTCPAIVARTCGPYCYAARMATLKPSVRRAWMVNTALLLDFPAVFWAETEAAYSLTVYMGGRWRWNVGGEVINADHAGHIIDLARKYPAVQAWTYTKRPEAFDAALDLRGMDTEPESLAVTESCEIGRQPQSRHPRPVSYVIRPEEDAAAIVDEYAAERVTICPGFCPTCGACESARRGELILFPVRK